MKSKGLGDTIDKITTATGIKAAIIAVTKDHECKACKKRQERLNKLVSYGK